MWSMVTADNFACQRPRRWPGRPGVGFDEVFFRRGPSSNTGNSFLERLSYTMEVSMPTTMGWLVIRSSPQVAQVIDIFDGNVKDHIVAPIYQKDALYLWDVFHL